MWKAVGSVHSGDDKSIRSNRSRNQIQFSPFHRNLQNRSANLSPKRDSSFCEDYLRKKREDGNKSSHSRVKSEKNLRFDQNTKEDMFTSMRNVIGNEIIDSRVTSKDKYEPQQSKIPSLSKQPQVNSDKNQKTVRLTMTRMKNLKKQQSKLKKTIQDEFTTFKNMFYQIQDVIHCQNQKTCDFPKTAAVTSGEVDLQFLKGILQEAIGIEKYFIQMDRKKMAIMERLPSD